VKPEVLNRLLKEHHLTGRELARILNVTEVSVSRWRHGARKMHPAYARLLRLHLKAVPITEEVSKK